MLFFPLQYTLFYLFSLTGHGQCNCGRCDCKEGWSGKKCEHPLSCSQPAESSLKKCRGTSNLPCFGRGTWSSPPAPVAMVTAACLHSICRPLLVWNRLFPVCHSLSNPPLEAIVGPVINNNGPLKQN